RQLQKGYPQCSVVMLGLAKGNSGRNSRVQLGRTVLDSARPGSDSRVAATVRVQKGERIRGARVTGNRDQHPSTRGQCIENAAVMGLKPDPAHGARETKFRQIAAWSLKRGDERPATDRGANAGQVDPFGR